MIKPIEVQEANVVESLRDLTNDMDIEMGGIGGNLETLWNIKVTLDNLRVSMDNRKDDEIRAYFREDHRTIQMLQDLMRYTMVEFGDSFQKAHDIHHEMFEKIMELDNKKAPIVTAMTKRRVK